MRRCYICREYLPVQMFALRSKTKLTYQAQCKSCQNEYSRRHYRANSVSHNKRRYVNQRRYAMENRIRMLEYLSNHRCVDCGELDPVVLDFDHVRGTKKLDVSRMMGGYTWRGILSEITKCEVRCANCHRRKTAKQFKWFKSFGM